MLVLNGKIYLPLPSVILLCLSIVPKAWAKVEPEAKATQTEKDQETSLEQTKSDIPQLSKIDPLTNAQLLLTQEAQPTQASEIVQVTGVRLNPTAKGLEFVLETPSGKPLQISTSRQGNVLIADIQNSQLALPNQKEFRADNPARGISAIAVRQFSTNSIRVSVTGTEAVLIAQVNPSTNTLILSIPQTVAESDEIEITVTGTRTARPVQDSSATITVIEANDIERNIVQNLDDLVRYEPGISTSRSPNRYGFQDFNIRGIDGNRILTQVDGVRLPEAFEFGSTQLGRDYIDPETLKRVEIIRGSASTLYGSDAIGGVVTFLTKDPSDFLNSTGDDAYGSAKITYDGVDRGFAETATLAGRYAQLDGFELGFWGNFPSGNFSLNGFYNTYQNFIDTFGRVIPTPELTVGSFQTVNRGEVRIYGVEGKGELPLGSGFSLLASTSYAVGDDLDSEQPLGSVEPFKAVAGLPYRPPQNNWGTKLFTTYAGISRLPKTTDLPNPFVPGSYFILDLTIFYNVTQNVSINLEIFNILNEKYWRRGDVRWLSATNSNLDLFVQPKLRFLLD